MPGDKLPLKGGYAVMRAYITETNRLNHHRRANREADLMRLEKARKAMAGIVTPLRRAAIVGLSWSA